ncbi:hypothetical protein VTL71DRAFT_2065 [Oculimacula yallundae]|uniref:Uncharacterized protein n=1 Tax=Oculimacula yallundae TaxID=86028 RepID=A0ABR4C7T4_9HELO
MNQPILLNETCVAALTSGYTNLTALIAGGIQQCIYSLPSTTSTSISAANCPTEPVFGFWSGFFFLVMIAIVVFGLVAACASASTNNKPSIPSATCEMRHLRSLPSHQLHRAVEKRFSDLCIKSDAAREEFDNDERYADVAYSEDLVARRRTVVITEDMDVEPRARAREVMAENVNYDVEREARLIVAGRDPVDDGSGDRRRAEAKLRELNERAEVVEEGSVVFVMPDEVERDPLLSETEDEPRTGKGSRSAKKPSPPAYKKGQQK